MKFKQLTIAYIFIAICITIFSSCNKKDGENNLEIKNLSIAVQAESLIVDDDFINLIKVFNAESIFISKLPVTHISSDTSNKKQIELIQTNTTKALATFLVNNPGFTKESKVNRELVLKYISDSISSESFRDRHSNTISKLIIVNDLIYKEQQNNKTIIKSTSENIISTHKLSRVIVLGCVIGALGSSLSSYGDVIEDVAYLITQGFSGTALINSAIDLIKNASPWWKVASIIIGFGGCLATSIE